MARCSTVSENKKIKQLKFDYVIELSESDEASKSSVEMEDSNDHESDEDFCVSSNREPINGESVFSLECLNDPPSTPPETEEVYDLNKELDLQNNDVSIKIEPVDEFEIIDLDEVPDLAMQSMKDSTKCNPEDIDEKIKANDPVLKQLLLLLPDHIEDINPTIMNANQFPIDSSLTFSSADYGGKHRFMIGVSSHSVLTRTEQLIYCPKQKKLYITKDQPFKIIVKAVDVPSGSFLKVFATFTRPEHGISPVRRCPVHEHLDLQNGVRLYKHFVLCLSDSAVYKEEHGVMSVSVPYEKPQTGEEYTYYLFKVTCYSSCTAGINKRPLSLVFCLERDGKVLGRQSVHTKVCAGPSRDYNTDLRKFVQNASTTSKSLKFHGFPANIVNKPEDIQKYELKVKDYKLYEFLRDMKNLYEASAIVQQLSKKNT